MKQAMVKQRSASVLGIILGLAISCTAFPAVTSAPTSTVKGRAPIAAPSVDNTAPAVGDTVTATSGFSDADGDAEQGTTWRWLLDGNPIAGALSNAYTLVAGNGNGRQLVVEATPATDPASTDPSQGAPVSSAVIITQGSAPVASVGAHKNTAFQYDLVTSGSYAYSDADGDAESGSIFNWLLDGASIGSGSITNGQTKNSRQLMPSDVGKSLVFSVTPKSVTGVPNTGTATASPAQTVVVPAGMQVTNFFTPNATSYTWSAADSFCQSLGGRLPTVTELKELFVNATSSQVAHPNSGYIFNAEMCGLHGWPLPGSCGGGGGATYWSSTSSGGGGHYTVSLKEGAASAYLDSNQRIVACVR